MYEEAEAKSMKRVQLLSIGMLVEVVVVLLGEKLVMMVMAMMIPGVGGGGGQDASCADE
jgi:uncharacterized membrane protein